MSLPVRRSVNYGGEPSVWGRVTGDRTLADKGQWAAQPNECVKIHVRLFAQACALTINTHWRWVRVRKLFVCQRLGDRLHVPEVGFLGFHFQVSVDRTNAPKGKVRLVKRVL